MSKATKNRISSPFLQAARSRGSAALFNHSSRFARAGIVLGSSIVGPHRSHLCSEALIGEAVCALVLVSLDPAPREQVRYHPWGFGKLRCLYPAGASQFLHKLALALVRDGHFAVAFSLNHFNGSPIV